MAGVAAGTFACGGDDGGGGSGGNATGGSGGSTGGSGGSTGGSGGSTGGSGGSTGGSGGSTGGSGGSTGGSGGSTGGSGGSTGGSGGSTGGSGGSTGGSGGSAGVSKDCAGHTFVGSCKPNTGDSCMDYYGSLWTFATVKSGCEGAGLATASSTKCVTTGSVGACAVSAVAQSCTVNNSFPPNTTTIAKAFCGGTFYPP